MHPLVELARAQTRTEATQLAYLEAGIRHAVRAGALQGLDLDFELFVESLETETEVLRPATTRLYTAEVTTTIDVWGRQSGLASEKIAELNTRVRASFAARGGTPIEPRTASRKVKTANADEIRQVLEDLEARASDVAADLVDKVMPDCIEALSKTGARPIELLGSSLEGDILTFQNAKATNGRAGGPTRPFSLVPFSAEFRAKIERLLPRLNDLLAQSNAVGRDAKGVLNLLAARLARSCARGRGRRLSLYSFRHAALAAWTHMGLSPAQIAALAGQVSIHTAPRHYSRSRNGLEMGDTPIPCPELVGLIEARHGITEPTKSDGIDAPSADVSEEAAPGEVDAAPGSMPVLPTDLRLEGNAPQSAAMDASWEFEPFPMPPVKEPDANAQAISEELARIAKSDADRRASEVEASMLGIRRRNSGGALAGMPQSVDDVIEVKEGLLPKT